MRVRGEYLTGDDRGLGAAPVFQGHKEIWPVGARAASRCGCSAVEYHTALMENIPYVPLGETFLYAAYRKDRLSNVLETPHAVFWNIVKK